MSEYGFFAFSEKQYAEGISKLQCDEVVTIPGGGFVSSDQADGLVAMMDRHSAELAEALKDHDFAVEAFRYELANHEYSYTGETDEAINALGLTSDQVASSELLSAALEKAMK